VTPSGTPAVPSPPAPLTPVADPDELVALLARLVEDASDPLATERALAGAMRLSVLPLAERNRLAGSLLKRARKQAMDDFDGPFSGHAIRADIGWLALTWATGELPPPSTAEATGWHQEGHDTPWPSRQPATLSGILSVRIGEACTLIAARADRPAGRPEVGLLAEPEFADGTISPGELAAREALWATAGLTPPRYDQEVARLRAAPAADKELALEPFASAPRSDSRGRQRGGHGSAAASTGLQARLARVPGPASAPLCWPLLTRLEHDNLDDRQFAVQRTGVRLDEMVATWALLCPRDPELIAAHLLSPLSDALGKGRNAGTTALQGLVGLSGPLGPLGHLALVTGLAAEAADVRIAAAEAWTLISAAGRIDPALAAEAIELGVSEGAFRLPRVADGLGYPTAADPAASYVARTCLLATAAMLASGIRPPGLHLLLELAASASAASGVAPELPARVAALAAGRATSKLAEAARRLRSLAAS